MNYKMMGKFLSRIIAIEGVLMLPALVISLVGGEWSAVNGFLITLAVTVVLGGGLMLLCRGAKSLFGAREGFACVAISWVVLSLIGCLPLWLSGEVKSFVDAFFEMVSGFTTTGASVLADVESLSKGLLYWRSFSHWLGGMGVLVFLLAIAPGRDGEKGFTMHLLRAESPGPEVGKLAPKMRNTAMILYLLYIGLTVVNVIFLLAGGMDFFEALCTAFGTAGTGGFGIKNDSMASYSPYIQNVTTVFMFLFGINFGCIYLLLLRQFRSVIRDEELRLYFLLAIGSVALIVWNIRPLYASWEETIRHAAFQVSSVMTTTGYATTDFDTWPEFSKSILLLLMLVGACAGSTGGGFKVARVLLLFKSLRRNIRQVINPRKVQLIRNNGRVLDEAVLSNTNAYLAAYVIILVLSVLVLSLDRYDLQTNVTAAIACFNNIGPGLAEVGPTCNFGGFSVLSKLILIVDMLAGRLEIFPMLILLSSRSWKSK